MKNEKGVSMLEIVVAIIILLIIAFFAIFNSRNAIPQAKAAEVYREMKSVETAIEAVRTNYVVKDDFEVEIGKHYDSSITEGDYAGYYVINGSLNHSSIDVAKNLGLSNLKRDYIVNYNTGDFKLKEAVKINGNQVTTLQEVESLINNGIQ